MAILIKRIRAFSLVEVLVAMVIIMIVFSLGITISLNVFASNGLERHMQARLVLDGYIAETIQREQFENGGISIPPYDVQRTVATHPVDKGLVKMAFVIKGQDEKILLTDERWIWLP